MLWNRMHFPFEKCFFMASQGAPYILPRGKSANCLLKTSGVETWTYWSEAVCRWCPVRRWKGLRIEGWRGLRYLPWPLDCIFISLPWCSLFLSILTQLPFSLWNVWYGSSLPLVILPEHCLWHFVYCMLIYGWIFPPLHTSRMPSTPRLLGGLDMIWD